MKYVVFFLAIAVGAIAFKFAGVSSSEPEYWVIYVSYQLSGYCIARIIK